MAAVPTTLSELLGIILLSIIVYLGGRIQQWNINRKKANGTYREFAWERAYNSKEAVDTNDTQ